MFTSKQTESFCVTVLILFPLIQRMAEEKAKKKVTMKRQEELEQKKKLEEEARRKKIQQAVRQCFSFFF